MKKTKLLITFSLLISTICFAQQPNEIEVSKRYNDYFKQESENIFTQLNKTNYTKNESLWFTSYVYHNGASKTYTSTTNIYINIYNSLGEMIDQKVFRCKDGYMQGQLKIDAKYKPGVYYIKSTTNWMRNFNVDLSDLKQFVVDSQLIINTPKAKYDFDIIPESGTLVNNIINTIGVKLHSETETSKLKGVVTDSKNTVITVFKFNEHGIGKFSALLSNNNQYQVTIYDNEIEKASKNIQQIKDTGLHLNLINKTESVVLTFTTNPTTLKNLIGKEYYLYLHRDGIINSIPIAFESNKTSYSLQINKTDLPKGITIFSLLNELNKPVLERLYFNDLNTKIGSLEVLSINKEKDSTTITLKTSINSPIKNNFSASVLPENSNVSSLTETIKTKTLLFPYIKSPVTNNKDYLKDVSRKSLYDLDLLLLTQGDSKQSLIEILNSETVANYKFDTGFKIKGKLNNTDYDMDNYVELVSSNNAIKAESDLTTENEFVFDDLYLGNNTEISFLLKDKKGKTLKIKPYFNLFPKPFTESIAVEKTNATIKEIIPSKINRNFIITNDVIALNEVELQAAEKKQKEMTRATKVIGEEFSTHIVFDDDSRRSQLITDVIRQNGFEVINVRDTVTITTRRAITFSTVHDGIHPAIFIDNVSIRNDSDLFELVYLTVADVKELYISHNGSIYGAAGAGGVINIFTKKGITKKPNNLHKTFDVAFGFEDSYYYQSPIYASTSSDFFSMYGVINWIPSVQASSNGIITLKVPNYSKEKVKLLVNGMDENGMLYALEKTIALD